MANIPELLSGHVTLEVECLDRLYLNGYIGKLATSGRLVTFMREQLGKPIPSPVVLGEVTERFRESVKALAERQRTPVYQFAHQERKDDVANRIRRQRGVHDGIVVWPKNAKQSLARRLRLKSRNNGPSGRCIRDVSEKLGGQQSEVPCAQTDRVFLPYELKTSRTKQKKDRTRIGMILDSWSPLP